MLSAENKQLRGGKITASQFWKVVSLKGKLTETAITYLYEVIAEIMTNGLSIDTNEFSSIATDWGNEYEPIARKVYAEYKGVEVKLSNFTEHSLYAGCTPDVTECPIIDRIEPKAFFIFGFRAPRYTQVSWVFCYCSKPIH